MEQLEEIWKGVVGWEDFYEVSNLGRVRSVDRYITTTRQDTYLRKGKILKQKTNTHGYKCIGMYVLKRTKHVVVHRLVAQAFLSNIDNLPQVNHIDGDKTNNNVLNLEWCTAKENIQHSLEMGLKAVGERSPMSTVNEDVVRGVCKLLEEGVPNTEIANLFCIGKDLVGKIKIGKSWVHISKEYNIPKRTRGVPEDVVIKICELLQEGFTAEEVLSKLPDQGLTLPRIYAIRKRENYAHISKDYNWVYNSSKRGTFKD